MAFLFSGGGMARLIVIDNYDSFTYNLVQMFMQFDLSIRVLRSDEVSVSDVARMAPDYILISPGPKAPADAGVSVALIRGMYKKVPVLGVCLGMQCINEAFGGITTRASTLMHGKTSQIRHEGLGVFRGLPSPFTAARYHSLMVTPSSPELVVTSRSEDGVIMGLSHVESPLHGVQFHPESFLTEHGFRLVENFLGLGVLGEVGRVPEVTNVI
jgi:anthranilate synthase component 2